MLLCIGHSALLRTLSLSGALNRRVCGLLTLAQISQGETSHIPRALSERIFLGCAKLYIRELGCDGIASLPKAGER